MADGTKIMSTQINVAGQSQPVRPGDEFAATILQASDPRHNRAIAEAHDEFGVHRDATSQAVNDSDQFGPPFPPRHAVNDADGTAIDFEGGFKHHCVAAIGSGDPARLGRGRNEPTALFWIAQQGCEAGCAIETRNPKPIARAVAANQGRRLAIADNTIVLDATGHP
ncbi:hypothetical protein ABIB06_002132 [Bradyrhizobium sp. LB8.2]